jgi:maleylpyruvate isomerase
MKLYTYYRSQASFRVRIALNVKGIAREDSFQHLERATNSPPHIGRSIRKWWCRP